MKLTLVIFLLAQERPMLLTLMHHLNELMDWSKSAYEPPLTCMLALTGIQAFDDKPMNVPKWQCKAGDRSFKSGI